MSDLQLSLLAIGAVVIAGVYLFNWLQERKHRRGTEEAFKSKHEDVLLSAARNPPRERIEPALKDLSLPVSPDQIAGQASAGKSALMTDEAPADFIDLEIDYIAEIRASSPIGLTSVAEVLRRKFDFGKPVTWLGLNGETGRWEELSPDKSSNYHKLKASLQLADRSGLVSEVKLGEFRDMIQGLARNLNAVADCPDIQEARAEAALLDQFCSEVDVLIGLNIVSMNGGGFSATKIRALAEASGFKLDPDGVFRYPDERGVALFALCNYESAPFVPDAIRSLTTGGITLLLDVPRVIQGDRAFDLMVSLARNLSDSLGGVLVDDNRVPLNDAGINRIRQQLQNIQLRMAERNISAGSARALRLFS